MGMFERWMIFFAIAYFGNATGVELKPFTNDQCPDPFDAPLEYRNNVQYVVINNTLHGNQPCVVITQCSVDRLHNLEKLANAWNGAISAAVYVSTASSAVQSQSMAKIEAFATKMRKSRAYRGWLSISVLYGHEDSPWRYDCPEVPPPRMPLYPINNLRNLAVIGSSGPNSSTFPLYFLLDADFTPSVHLRSWIRTHAEAGLIERCRRGGHDRPACAGDVAAGNSPPLCRSRWRAWRTARWSSSMRIATSPDTHRQITRCKLL
jgi:hypothetical protein